MLKMISKERCIQYFKQSSLLLFTCTSAFWTIEQQLLLRVSCHYSSVAFNLSAWYSESSINVWLQMLHISLSRDCLLCLLKVDRIPYHSLLISPPLRCTICSTTSLLFLAVYCLALFEAGFMGKRKRLRQARSPLRKVFITALLSKLSLVVLCWSAWFSSILYWWLSIYMLFSNIILLLWKMQNSVMPLAW